METLRRPDGWHGDAVDLRIRAASLFLNLHVEACGPPTVDFFRAICMADAALFAIVSTKDLVGKDEREKLHDNQLFALLQCLRNITAHREVWPSRTSYVWGEALGSDGREQNDVDFFPLPFQIDEALADLATTTTSGPGKRKAIELARQFMVPYVSNEKEPFYIRDILSDGIELVRSIQNGATEK